MSIVFDSSKWNDSEKSDMIDTISQLIPGRIILRQWLL